MVGNCVGWADVGTTVGVKELYCAMVVGAKVGINVVHNLHDKGQAALTSAPCPECVQRDTSCAQEAGCPPMTFPVTDLSAQCAGDSTGSVVGSRVGVRGLN